MGKFYEYPNAGTLDGDEKIVTEQGGETRSITINKIITDLGLTGGTSTLDGLTDTTITTPSDYDVLLYFSDQWINQPLPIEELDNVNIYNPTQPTSFLMYDGIEWVDSLVSIDHLSETNISAPQTGEVLTYDSGAWQNLPISDSTPAWTLIQDIRSSVPSVTDGFGNFIRTSKDGTTMAVGAEFDATNGSNSGAVYIFKSDGKVWTQTDKLFSDTPVVSTYFGTSLDISDDGLTLIVGSQDLHAHIFVNTNGVWAMTQEIVAVGIVTDDFYGKSVAISGDGQTCAVGASRQNDVNTDCGNAYIWTRSGETWTEQQTLPPSDGQVSDFYGESVDLSADGRTLLVGAFGRDTGGSNTGAVYAWTSDGATWTERQIFRPTDSDVDDWFGTSLAITRDGTRAVIGAVYADPDNANETGSAYIYDTSDGGITWTEESQFIASDGVDLDEFAWSVDISDDGLKIVIGAVGKSGGGYDGGVYIYEYIDGVWEETTIIDGPVGVGEEYGINVDISSDGNFVNFCADGVDVFEGAVYVYQAPNTTIFNDLTNITISDPSNGEVLTYSSGQWVNASPSVTNLGTLSATCDMTFTVPEREIYSIATLGAVDCTFNIVTPPTGPISSTLELVTGGTVGALTFTDATPTPTIEINKTYRMIWTPKYASTGYWLQVAEIT